VTDPLGDTTANRTRRRRSAASHILIALHQACDLEVAEQLLAVLAMVIASRRHKPAAPDQRDKESLVAAYERLWDLRHPDAGAATCTCSLHRRREQERQAIAQCRKSNGHREDQHVYGCRSRFVLIRQGLRLLTSIIRARDHASARSRLGQKAKGRARRSSAFRLTTELARTAWTNRMIRMFPLRSLIMAAVNASARGKPILARPFVSDAVRRLLASL
jgi:hypothetical protein